MTRPVRIIKWLLQSAGIATLALGVLHSYSHLQVNVALSLCAVVFFVCGSSIHPSGSVAQKSCPLCGNTIHPTETVCSDCYKNFLGSSRF